MILGVLILGLILLGVSCKKEKVPESSLTSNKSVYKELEMVLINGHHIDFKSSNYIAKMGSEDINLLKVNDQLVFIIPELGFGNHTLEVTIEGTDFSLDLKVDPSETVADPEVYLEFISSTVLLGDLKVSEIQVLTYGMSDTLEEKANKNILAGYYSEYTAAYVGMNGLERASLAKFVKANEDLFTYEMDLTSHVDSFNVNRFGTANVIRLKDAVQNISSSKVKLVALVAITALAIDACVTVPSPWTCGAAALSGAALAGKIYHHNSMIKTYVDKVFTPVSIELDGMNQRSNGILSGQLYALSAMVERRTFYNADMGSKNVAVNDLILELNESETTWAKIMSILPISLQGTSAHIKNTYSFKAQFMMEKGTYLSIGNISNSKISLATQNQVDNELQVTFTTNEITDQYFSFDLLYDDGEFQFAKTINKTLEVPVNCTSSFIDTRDGEEYCKVIIGSQTWMAENLRFNAYGSVVNPNNPTSRYGRLYDFPTVMNGETTSNTIPSGVQGICPNGWHLPSDDEWKILEMSLGMSQVDADDYGGNRGTNQGVQMKSATGWNNNGNGTNSSGFNALPAGAFNSLASHQFRHLGERTVFWSSTKYNMIPGICYRFFQDVELTSSRYFTQTYPGQSCRCVQD